MTQTTNNIKPLYNEYEGQARRPLTFAERKINLVWLKETMKRLSDEMDAKLAKIKADLLAGPVAYDVQDAIVKIVTETQKKAFDYWKQTASSEMKVPTKATNSQVVGVMRSQNNTVIGRMLADIKKKYKAKWHSSFAEAQFFSENGILSQFFNGLKSLYVMGAINLGRETVFEQYPDRVYAFQYSAILDDRTTDICRGLDGIIVKPNSVEYEMIRPPRHWNCRSILVEILTDEPYKPMFTRQEKMPTEIGVAPTVEEIDKRQQKQQKLIDVENSQ